LWLVYSKTSSKSSNLPTTDWAKKEVRMGIQFMRQGNKISGITASPCFTLLRTPVITKTNLTTRTAYIVLLLCEKKW